MFWKAKAPSNIALIKYLGKKDETNRPLNPSLSYTLNHLLSVVQIHPLPQGASDRWELLEHDEVWDGPKKPVGEFKLQMSSANIDRFLQFFQFLKNAFYIPGSYRVLSGNNFPAGAGVASSASSFCALTQATYKLGLDCSLHKQKIQKLSMSQLSAFSRQGSGSSCRSFFSPWALWEEENACFIDLPYPQLVHQLIITSAGLKKQPSSIAHRQVLHSPLFKGRVKRATQRLAILLQALKEKNWQECFKISWEECQDLHTLYETANPPIFYRNKASHAILNKMQQLWEKEKDGPLVTMDAGPNVHLLYRLDQKPLAHRVQADFSSDFQIISSL